MTTIGPTFANADSINFDIGAPAAQWSATGQVEATDGNTADATVAGGATNGTIGGTTQGSDVLSARNNSAFSAINAGDTINGVEVTIFGWTDVGNITLNLFPGGYGGGSSPKQVTLTTTHQALVAGSSSDNWSGASNGPYLASTIHGSGPSVDIFVAPTQTDNVHIDSVKFTVYYTAASGQAHVITSRVPVMRAARR